MDAITTSQEGTMQTGAHFPFYATAYGQTFHGIGYTTGWHYASGRSALVGYTPAQQNRIDLRMKRAWEEAHAGECDARSRFEVASLKTGHDIYSPNYGGSLKVSGLGYGKVSSESVIAGHAKPISAELSADGRHFRTGAWHEGPEAEPVYVERHDQRGCFFHGWVDSVSRQLVQAG